MELEQLVSFCRYERSRLAAWAALDEVLTVVLEARDRVDAAEKQVKEHETKLEGLQAAFAQANAEHEAHVEKAEQASASRLADQLSKFNHKVDKAKSELVSLQASTETTIDTYNREAAHLMTIRQSIKDAKVEKADLTSDVATLRKQLQDIKDSIK